MKQARTNYKPKKLKVSRIARVCDIFEKPINKGEKYGSTNRGTIYCERCK